MSLIKNAARFVSSSWWPKRFMGLELRVCSSNCFEGTSRDHAPSVGNGPGAMAFKRMLYLPHSTASDVVIASTPALAHAEGTTNAEPQFAAAYVVVILKTCPGFFCAIHLRANACVQ